MKYNTEINAEFKTKEEIFEEESNDFANYLANFYYNNYNLGKPSLILIGGNGGSASQADHFVGELIGDFDGISSSVPAVSISSNSAVLTALANDYNYESAFSRIIGAFNELTSVFIGLSTSGNSNNIYDAIQEANAWGIVTFSITGNRNSKVARESMHTLEIKGSTQVVQEQTLKVLHKIAGSIKALVETKSTE